MPPVPPSGLIPQSCIAPRIQPLRMSGSVTQFGTLSAQPSMNAARIIPKHTTMSGPPLRPVGENAAQILAASTAATTHTRASSGIRDI